MAGHGAAASSRLDEFLAHPKRAVWTLALPMMASFTVHALYTVVDTAFVGMLGAEALAAATFVVGPFFVAFALANGLAAGITAGIAQAVGRRDAATAQRLASVGFAVALGLGLVLMVAGLLFAEPGMLALGAKGRTAALATTYFRWVSLGMPLFFASGALRAVLMGEGDAKAPMVVIGLSTVLNLGLDPLLIFTLGLGIAGAAMATLAAQALSFLVLGYLVFVRRRSQARPRLADVLPARESLLRIARIGAPAAAGQLVMALGMGLSARVISEFGQRAVAGYGAGSKVDLIVALPILGLATATVSVVGMFAGAGRADLVRQVTLYTYRSVVLVAAVFGSAAYLAADTVIGLFTRDALAVSVGREYLAYMVFAYPLMAFGITSGRILQGLGYGMPSLLVTLVRVPLIGVGGAYAAVYLFGAPITAVWLSFIAGGVAANVLSLLWVRSAVWRNDPTRLAGAA
jgi:putative MATE family efflux protein